MFDQLTQAIQAEQQKIQNQINWVKKFKASLDEKEILPSPWKDKSLIHGIKTKISKLTKIAGVDGGVIAEAMTGFDLILYRAVAAIFQGIGDKVESDYIPSFDPEPRIFFSPSLSSRLQFSKITTLMRLYAEYEVAKQTIETQNPTVIFIDGKVSPLTTDFGIKESQSKLVKQAELDVKQMYRELITKAFENQVLLCGVIKDSRSREFTSKLEITISRLVRTEDLDSDQIKGWATALDEMQDIILGEALLQKGERTAWLESASPTWLPPQLEASIWTCLVRPLADDQPVRLEVILGGDDFQEATEVALGSLQTLCTHGLPIALPTVILEADDRTKLSADHLESIIDQISLALGVPKDKLRKRRHFKSSLSRL